MSLARELERTNASQRDRREEEKKIRYNVHRHHKLNTISLIMTSPNKNDISSSTWAPIETLNPAKAQQSTFKSYTHSSKHVLRPLPMLLLRRILPNGNLFNTDTTDGTAFAKHRRRSRRCWCCLCQFSRR